MQLVLEKDDLESLIKERYRGVSEIKFNTKNVKATLEVDIDKFNSVGAIRTLPITKDQMKTPEEPKELTNEERLKKGGMAAGGSVRALQHLG